MKSLKVLFTIIATSFAISSFGQCPLTLADLEKASVLSKGSFDTWALNKGYSQNPIKGDGQFDYVQYWCDNANSNGVKDQVGRLAGDGVKTSIGFTTSTKQLFLNFKADLIAKGYKLQEQKEQKVGGEITATWYYYTNGKYQVDFYSYYLPNDGITRYVMDVYKL